MQSRPPQPSKSGLFAQQTALPYQTKADFIAGVGKAFYDGDFFDEARLDKAWRVYRKTVQSKSEDCAVLYKMCQSDEYRDYPQYGEHYFGATALNDGRIYTPLELIEVVTEKTDFALYDDRKVEYRQGAKNQVCIYECLHSWNLNLCWLMAQTHIQRPFFVISPLTDTHLYRRHAKGQISAFAKELHCAVQAGYQFYLTEVGELFLAPDDDAPLMTYSDFDLDDEAVIATYRFAQNVMRCRRYVDLTFLAAESLFEMPIETESVFRDALLDTFKDVFKHCMNDEVKHIMIDYIIQKSAADLPFLDEFEKPEDRLTELLKHYAANYVKTTHAETQPVNYRPS